MSELNSVQLNCPCGGDVKAFSTDYQMLVGDRIVIIRDAFFFRCQSCKREFMTESTKQRVMSATSSLN